MDAFTIGESTSYNDDLAKRPFVTKIGKRPNYNGGWVWKTKEEASKFIKEQLPVIWPDKIHLTFKVYGLILPHHWEKDVSPEVESDGVHRLINDAKIVHVD